MVRDDAGGISATAAGPQLVSGTNNHALHGLRGPQLASVFRERPDAQALVTGRIGELIVKRLLRHGEVHRCLKQSIERETAIVISRVP